MRHADTDLIPARVGRLVAEEEEVERLGLAVERLDDRACRRLRIPLLSLRLEEDAAVGADRHAVAELLLRLGRAEGHHHDLAPFGFDDAHRLLDRALLVRRDREAEMPGLERLRIVGEHHLPARERDALDADENPHERILSLSGSNGGREPTTSTVTGWSSSMYWT